MYYLYRQSTSNVNDTGYYKALLVLKYCRDSALTYLFKLRLHHNRYNRGLFNRALVKICFRNRSLNSAVKAVLTKL